MPLTEGDLGHFTGSATWTRHGLCRNVIYSEGMAFMAERGNAYWLIDAIASHEALTPKLKAACRSDAAFDYLHFWTLNVYPNDPNDREGEDSGHYAILTCRKDSGLPAVVTQKIEFTDFPLKELKVYAGNDGPGTPRKLFLRSEY